MINIFIGIGAWMVFGMFIVSCIIDADNRDSKPSPIARMRSRLIDLDYDWTLTIMCGAKSILFWTVFWPWLLVEKFR